MIFSKRQINLLFLTGVIVISALFSATVYAEEYDFVTCPEDDNIYPEGTDCNGLPDSYNDDADNHDSDEATEDEEDAMKESEDD